MIVRRRRLAHGSSVIAPPAWCEGLEARRLLAVGASVSGRVFRDFNSNNVYEPGIGETPLGGIRVFLDRMGGGFFEPSEPNAFSSSADGTFTIADAPDGSYVVRQLNPLDHVSPATYPLTVSGATVFNTANFGNFPLVYTGSAGDDAYSVRLEPFAPGGTQLVVTETVASQPTRTYSGSISAMSGTTFSRGLTINGDAGDDLLTLNYAKGEPLPPSGILFNGGGNDDPSLGDGLVISGTSGNDSATVRLGGELVAGSASVAAVERVSMTGGFGSDFFTLHATSAPDIVNAEASNLSIGNTTFEMSGVERCDVQTAEGADQVTFNGRGGANLISLGCGYGNDTIIAHTGADITVNGMEDEDALIVDANADVSISTVLNMDWVTIEGTAGDDTITLGSSTGGPFISAGSTYVRHGFPDGVVINGNGGNDALTIANGRCPVTLSGGDGNDTLTMQLTTWNSRLDGGSGDDVLNLGSGSLDLAPGYTPQVTLRGQDGSDAFFIRDAQSTVARAYGVFSASVQCSPYVAYYQTMESLTLECSGADNAISVYNTSLATPVTIQGADGNETLSFPLSPASSDVLFEGGLDSADAHTLNVGAGTFTFDEDAASHTSNLTVNLTDPSAAVIFEQSQHLASLNVSSGSAAMTAAGAGAGKVLVTGELVLAAGATLDLTDNDLIVDYSSVSPVGVWTGSAYDGVTGYIQSARIISSAASANLTQLGVAEAREALGISGTQSGTFAGQSVDSTAVLVKFTWGGDANLDGKVNIDDYGRIDGNVVQSGSVFGWFNGDFNYEGKINIDDYGIIDGNINLQDAVL